jgi:hypothetical protein
MTEDTPLDSRQLLPSIDVSKPNVARVYDALLGGKDNFAADREFVAGWLTVAPKAALGAVTGRNFLRRVVRYLVSEAGITQFLDIGSGLPTQGNVSEVAHEVNPAARVVHVDNDPVVYSHGMALLANERTSGFVLGDIRRPAEILGNPGTKALIDFTQPVGLLLLSILHHVKDHEDPAGIAAQLRDAMPPGSYLAISSLRLPSSHLPERAFITERQEAFEETLGSGSWRTDEEILSWFGDWELAEPGYGPLMDWRPPVQGGIGRDPIYHTFFGGVARKTQGLSIS